MAKSGKETGHLGIKIAGVSCKIWEFCMILKKLQLGMGPVSGPCETRDKALWAVFKVTARDQGQYKGPSGAFVTHCNISCFRWVEGRGHRGQIKVKMVIY